MKNMLIVSILLTLISATSIAQNNIGIGTTTPNASAMLDVSSTSKGILIPRMTTVQRIAINPAASSRALMVFDTDSSAFFFWTGAVWSKLGGGGGSTSPWVNIGNNIFNSNIGNVGIGVANPQYQLEVRNRMRLRGGANVSNTAGIWLSGVGADSLIDKVFVGLSTDSTAGFYGSPSGWVFQTNLKDGATGFGINTPNPSAQLDVSSTNKGFLMPRMTALQRDNITSPAEGLQIYNIEDQCINTYSGGKWTSNCTVKQTGTATIAGGNWVQKKEIGADRGNAVAFSINNKGYTGTGRGSGRDMWEYDPATNIWERKADLPGAARYDAIGFAIGSKGYVGLGDNGGSGLNDFWEFEPLSNTWIARAAYPGLGRKGVFAFSLNGKGYAGGGISASDATVSDFWEYDPIPNTWTAKAGIPQFLYSAGFSYGVGFSIGAKGYIGLGFYDYTGCNFCGTSGSLFEYDPATNSWQAKAQIANGTTGSRRAAVFVLNNEAYTGAGEYFGGSSTNTFWKYSPVSNNWVKIQDMDGPSRTAASGFTAGNNGYVVGGNYTPNGELWQFTTDNITVPVYSNTAVPSASVVTDGAWTRAGQNIYNSTTGNVGIGITTPSNKLSVGGNVDFTGNVGIGNNSPNAPLQFATVGANRKIVLYEGANNDHQFYGFGIGNSTMNYQVGGSVASHVFYAGDNATNSIELLRIKGDGKVGIGTSSPSNKLSVSGNADFTGNVGIGVNNPSYRLDVGGRMRIRSGGDANSTAGIWFNNDANTTSPAFIGMLHGNDQVGILGNGSLGWGFVMNTATGNIGISKTNPNARLQFGNVVANRTIVLWETANNDHQFYGFGINGGTLRYQTPASTGDHVFFSGASTTTSAELLRIKGNGHVGIGISDPVFVLDVGSRMRIRATPGSSAGLWLNNEANTAMPAFIGMQTDNLIGFFAPGNGWIFNLNTTTGNANLSGSLTQNSDARLKKDIIPLSNSLEAIQQLSGYSYHWKNTSNPEEQIGLLAQEIQKVYPQLVKENEQGTLSVNYSGMVPVLLEAIKEQQSQITELKKLITQLIKQSK